MTLMKQHFPDTAISSSRSSRKSLNGKEPADYSHHSCNNNKMQLSIFLLAAVLVGATAVAGAPVGKSLRAHMLGCVALAFSC